MILLKKSLAAGLDQGDKASVLKSLQSAIELEHSTIPLYLYALYSLDESANGAVAEIIESVAVEEMLHMTLACNILNALGGSPVIDKPGFIPTYPGHLPGGVDTGLIVSLAPFSYDQLDTFLSIEQPENPLDFPLRVGADGLDEDTPDGMTIGQFYTQIGQAITKLGDSAFLSPSPNQIGPELMDNAIVVTNVATALDAINLIIDQGEGTENSPKEQVGDDYAHYYRFMEIKMGRRLVQTPGTSPSADAYSYSGAPVPVDLTGVYPVPTNPKRSLYPDGTAARIAFDTFNYTYTSLLKTLHAVFNGQAVKLRAAIGLMMSLKAQAKDMMSGTPNPQHFVGPSFEYQPTNPPQ